MPPPKLNAHGKDAAEINNKKLERRLKEISKRPENRNCADCRDKDPRWCSWNLGIFLCINCCGRHRGLGTHISKVKSIDLDKWQQNHIDNLDAWGNYKANLYWEAKLPQDKVNSICTQSNFVRRKYEGREFVKEPEVPVPTTLEPSPHSQKKNKSSLTNDTLNLSTTTASSPLI